MSATGTPGRPDAALAGTVAAASALAAGELAVALSTHDGPSLVTSVGSSFIDQFAAALKDLAVALFGTGHKTALIVGIVVVCLSLGAASGIAARRERWRGAAGFAAFGVVGLLAYLDDPLGSPATGVAAALVAVSTGTAVLLALLRLASPTSPASEAPETTEPAGADDGVMVDGRLVASPRSPFDPRVVPRRAFLATVALVGAGAAGLAVLGRRLTGSGASEASRAEVVLPPPDVVAPPPAGEPFAIAGLTPYITGNGDFYRIDTALSFPQVDAADWTLEVNGLVDRPFSLTYDELLAMDSVSETVTLSCVSNEVGGDLVGNALWQGVPLAALLERAGVQAGADQLVGRSLDDWTGGFPTEAATDGRVALVAYAMNGEPLPVRHGFPVRLVVEGLYGYVSATKWLKEITLTTWEDFDGYWIPRGWSKEGPVKTQSRIDVPRVGRDIAAGPVPVAGVAWAPGRGIERVEVRVDDGPWQECRLGEVASDATWVQWTTTWQADPGEHHITVRATDGTGAVQTEEVARPDPDGATGWHTRRLVVRQA